MTGRIWTLTRYFTRGFFSSLAGALYGIVTLAFWLVFFNPSQQTPEFENYFLIIGAFGGMMTFLTTLTIAGKANQALNYPLITPLPSRVEYITAVFAASFISSGLLQGGLGILALYHGPELAFANFVKIPPVWTSLNILTAILALHASDLVANGWSRVYLYGVLAVFLFLYSAGQNMYTWLAQRFHSVGYTISTKGVEALGGMFNDMGSWLTQHGSTTFGKFAGVLFWPFKAVADAITAGYFTRTQALAPAVLLLYATILFLLAADLFANKNLDFIE